MLKTDSYGNADGIIILEMDIINHLFIKIIIKMIFYYQMHILFQHI